MSGSPIIRRTIAAGGLSLLLASCGGGGGNGDPFGVGGGGGSNAPCILAQQIDFPPGGVPAGFNTGTSVAVLDNSCVNPIPNASVTMNGVTLPYNSTNLDYEAVVLTTPGGSINLKVVVNGVAYTASGTQFTSYPAISAPSAGQTWQKLTPNLLAWSGGGPAASASYGVGVLDTADPNGSLLWPSSGSLDIEDLGTTNISISPGLLTVGNRLVIVGILANLDIPGAALGSGFVVGGFSYAPITVVDGTQPSPGPQLQSIAVTPANTTLGVGVSRYYFATGTYSNNTTGNVGFATWTSSDTNIATVDSFGSVTGTGVGSATITATLGNISGSTQVTVVPLQSIAITPAPAAVDKGKKLQFLATGTFADTSTANLTAQVTWSSLDPGKATVSNNGLATGAGIGVTTISATSGSVVGSASITVVPGFASGVKYANPFSSVVSLGDTAVGDLNGDGRNDVAVIESFLPTRILVYYQNAQGTFDPPQLIMTDLSLKGIAIADVNNDGFADLLVSGNSKTATSGFIGRIAVYRQDSTSHVLGAPQELTVSSNNVGPLAVADLNGDSLPDIVAAGTGSGTNGVVSMFFQGPGGALGSETTYNNVPVVVAIDHGELHVADMNNDGLNDIVLQSGEFQFAVIKQTSAGVFSATPDFYTAQTNYWGFFNSLELGDLNGDGLIDVAVADLTGNLNLFYQNAAGTLDGPTILAGNPSTEVQIADLNGDGLNDIVLLNDGNLIRVLYQTAVHSFTSALTYPLPTLSTGGTFTHQAVSVADLNGDGLPDIVASWSSEGIFVLLRNQ